jgi:glycosyltransferase involved in cell wall biosynthesis
MSKIPSQLTVIVPVFNEAPTITELLNRVCDQSCVDRVVVVNDGSTDGTKAALSVFEGHSKVDVFDHDVNCGKGTSIRTGLSHVKTEFVLVQDADLEYEPADISSLMDAMATPGVDVVYGSRYLESPGLKRGRYAHQSCVRLLNLMCRVLYGLKTTDEATCYKLFRTADLRRMNLECRRFEFCPEVTAKAAKMQLKMVEVPIRYTPRTTAEGKKIRFRDAVEAIWELLRQRVKSLR